MSRVLRTYEINPDGVHIHIDWSRFKVGSSFFIPCINTEKAKAQVNKIIATMDAQVTFKARSEGGKWGLRVWRTL